MTAEDQRDFVRDYLGPLLRANHPDVGIWVHEDQKDIMVCCRLKNKKKKEKMKKTPPGLNDYRCSETKEKSGTGQEVSLGMN
jgi:hypothetical protein